MRRQPTNAGRPVGQRTQNVYHVRHEHGRSVRLRTTLSHALADVADVDVTVAERALFDRVDPAALDDLFAPSGRGRAAAGASLSFGIWTYAVTVRADGAIEIRDTRQPGPESTYSPHPR